MKSETKTIIKPESLRSITAGTLLDKNFPAREFAVDPWLRTGESAMIWAATGVGKTWLTLSLAIAMAGGGKVWEWQSPEPRKVLLIDGEMNVQDLQDRIRFLIDSGAVSDIDIEGLRKNLVLMPRQFQSPRAAFYDITNEADQERVLTYMEEIDAEVIIIDNLTTCADGLRDENDATAFRTVMTFMLMMKQANKTSILVHHANKGGNDARGSTALEATFEVKLGLKRPPVNTPDSASFIAEFGKLRSKGNDSVARPRVWTLGETGWDVHEDEDTADARVIAALKTLKFINQSELGAALNMSQATVSRSLQKAIAIRSVSKADVDNLFVQARDLRNGDGYVDVILDDTEDENDDF